MLLGHRFRGPGNDRIPVCQQPAHDSDPEMIGSDRGRAPRKCSDGDSVLFYQEALPVG
jgi:hypothetical protein